MKNRIRELEMDAAQMRRFWELLMLERFKDIPIPNSIFSLVSALEKGQIAIVFPSEEKKDE